LVVALTDNFTDSASVIIGEMFMAGFVLSGQHVGWEIAAILGARVGRMTAERVKLAARMLPDSTPLIPVKAQRPKHLCQHRFPRWRHVEPNPLADDLGNLVLPRQLCPQEIQDCIGGQST
jgi:hypothetical protein